MSPPLFYSFRRCPYAMRARLALQVAGQKVALREVVLRDKPPEMLEVSPKGTVPVLVEASGNVIEESLDIMLWALENHDPLGWLRPASGNLAEMLDLIQACEDDFKEHLDRYKYASRYEGSDALEHRQAASAYLQLLDRKLSEGVWLFGEQVSLADAAIAPFVRQFANTDREWFDAQSWHQLRLWLDAFLRAPVFLSIMNKYPRWQAGDPEIPFPESDERSWLRAI